MTDPTTMFAKMVPGFDFLQGLVKNAGSAMPSVGQWVAPTLNPEEIEKRISELKTVQFWLEQNARMLGATIQALEVQRMTLSTLQNMNVSMGDLTESLKIRMPTPATPQPEAAPSPAPRPAPHAAEPGPTVETTGGSAVPAGVVDPMQWWGALTKQFTELASSAMKEGSASAATSLAGDMVKQGMDAASQTFKKAAGVPMAVAKTAASAAKAAAGGKSAPAARKKPAAKRR